MADGRATSGGSDIACIPAALSDARCRSRSAFVATHNHFVLDRGGKVFNQIGAGDQVAGGGGGGRAPRAARGAQLVDRLLLAQAEQPRQRESVEARGFTGQDWERFFEFTGTTLQDFPLPAELPAERGAAARRAGAAARRADSGRRCVPAEAPTREALKAAHEDYDRIRAEMIAQQEELDWEVYRRYGLVDDDLTYSGDDLPRLDLGERAFEIVLARRIAAGEEESAWFARHGSTPITEVPAHWPAAYRELVERRIALAIEHPYLRLLEKPEHKRRWAAEPWEKQQERALRGWLLDRLEDRKFWFDRAGPAAAPLGRAARRRGFPRPELVDVLALWEGRPDVPVSRSLARLLDGEAVPFLAAYRYKESGLRKRAAWEHTWDLQRREDAGTYDAAKDGPIPVPPKYTSADFTKVAYWSHRGKLDVPKERFVLYPGAGRDTDPTALLGWAGWDHAQQALALAPDRAGAGVRRLVRRPARAARRRARRAAALAGAVARRAGSVLRRHLPGRLLPHRAGHPLPPGRPDAGRACRLAPDPHPPRPTTED